MATIPRTYLTTSKSELPNIPIKNGQVISIWDSDEVFYDVPDNGTPDGNPVRRKISGVRVVSDLPGISDAMEGILYVYTPENDLPDLRIWVSEDWLIVGNITDDVQVQTDTSDGKFYLTGTNSISDNAVGTLLKNANIYVNDGDLYVDSGELYVRDGINKGLIHANVDGNATTATSATSAETAQIATSAITDNASTPNNITSYLHSVEIDSVTNDLTFTKGDGTTTSVTLPNTEYEVFNNTTDGLTPKTSSSTPEDLILTGTGWEENSNISVGSATIADAANNDEDGDPIVSTYYADVSYATATGLTLSSKDGTVTKSVNLPISDYQVFTPSKDGLVPKPSGAGETNMFLRGDGQWESVPVNIYIGATALDDGEAGLVPPADAGEMYYFLRGDGNWGTVFDTDYPGLVPSPLLGDADLSLRADGTWQSASGDDTKDTAGASQVEFGVLTTDTFVGDGTTTSFTLSENVIRINSVTVDDVEVTEYTYSVENNSIIFETAPADTSEIVVIYTTSEPEILYVIGAKVQDGGNNSPITYSTNKVYIQSNVLYSNGNEVIDAVSQQDMVNKTFNGSSLGSSAFVQTSESVTLTQVTISDTFTGDGETVDFTTNNQVLELDEVSVNGIVKTIDVDYTFDIATSTVTFMVAPVAPHYDLLTLEPSDWSTDYASYFTKDENDQYINVEGVATYTTNIESDWDLIGNNIWKYEDNTYVQIFTKPDNWDTKYGDYFTRSFVVPTFATDTYYELISEDIVIKYLANDPNYDTGNVPINSAVISYTNGRMASVQQDLTRRVSTQVAAPTYNEIQIDTFTGDGTTVTFTLTKQASGISEVTIADVATTDYTFDSTNNQITFTVAPGNGTSIIVSYTLTYNVGDYVMYFNGETTSLYRCNTPITAKEVFTPTHWDSVLLTALPNRCYTSTEKLVGTWIDNSDLYEQTITISNLVASTSQAVSHSISADKIFIAGGFTEYTVSNHKYYGMLSTYDTTASTEELRVKVDDTNIVYVAGNDLSGATAYVTVRYTKPQT